MLNKLLLALATLGLAVSAPANADPRVSVRIETPGVSARIGDNPRYREYRYHKRLNRDFDRQPYCNRHKPYLIRDAYTGRLKCVSRHRYERYNWRGW